MKIDQIVKIRIFCTSDEISSIAERMNAAKQNGRAFCETLKLGDYELTISENDVRFVAPVVEVIGSSITLKTTVSEMMKISSDLEERETKAIVGESMAVREYISSDERSVLVIIAAQE